VWRCYSKCKRSARRPKRQLRQRLRTLTTTMTTTFLMVAPVTQVPRLHCVVVWSSMDGVERRVEVHWLQHAAVRRATRSPLWPQRIILTRALYRPTRRASNCTVCMISSVSRDLVSRVTTSRGTGVGCGVHGELSVADGSIQCDSPVDYVTLPTVCSSALHTSSHRVSE